MSYAKGAQTYFRLQYYYQLDAGNCPTGPSGNNGQIGCLKDLLDDGRTENFVYDALGRLTSTVTNGSTAYAKWSLAQNFDRYGNRLSEVLTAGSGPSNSLSFATTPAPPANPPGGAYTNRPDSYSFDAAGNMLSDGVNTLTYDAENCLTSAGTAAYTCDFHGIRVKKALQGSTNTVYVVSGGEDISEYDYTSGAPSPSSPSREYIYFGNHLIATIQSGSPTYHHQDHLSVRVNTDASGNKIGEQGHYPYGELWYASNSTTKFIYSSYERDAESGNDYAIARYYINRYARFCTADPVMGTPADPQSWNRYAYVRNDPANITDPSGKNWFVDFLVGFFKTFLSMLTGGKFGTIVHVDWPGTPPTLPSAPGVPGDTTVLLNSIYHPVSLNSPYVISETGAFSGLSDPAKKDGFDVDKIWKTIFPCTRSAAQMGRALVQNFTNWAATTLKGPGDTSVQFFFWPGGPMTEGATVHPMGLLGSPTNGSWQLTTVKVSDVSDSGFTFTTVPSEHFFDGTVDFRIRSADTAGSVIASVTAKADWAHLWQYGARDIILNQEDQAWTHLLGRIQQECQQKVSQ
jgi:RHS repeat-associated protein